jgi:hypothetical protein
LELYPSVRGEIADTKGAWLAGRWRCKVSKVSQGITISIASHLAG